MRGRVQDQADRVWGSPPAGDRTRHELGWSEFTPEGKRPADGRGVEAQAGEGDRVASRGQGEEALRYRYWLSRPNRDDGGRHAATTTYDQCGEGKGD